MNNLQGEKRDYVAESIDDIGMYYRALKIEIDMVIEYILKNPDSVIVEISYFIEDEKMHKKVRVVQVLLMNRDIFEEMPFGENFTTEAYYEWDKKYEDIVVPIEYGDSLLDKIEHLQNHQPILNQ